MDTLQKKEELNITDLVFGSFLFLPIFLMINGLSVSLPESYYNPSGFPLHLGMLFFIFYFPKIRVSKFKLGIMLCFLLYSALWLYEPGRAAFLLQSYLFLFYFFYFDSLPRKKFFNLLKYGINAIKVFAALHILSFLIGPVSAESYGFAGSITSFYGYPIYQAGLSYPIVLIFALIIDKEIFSSENDKSYWFFLGCVLIIELLLARKVAIGFMGLYLLFYHPFLSMAGLFGVIFSALVFNIDLSLLFTIVERFQDLFDSNREWGGFHRAGAYYLALEVLRDPYALFLGNGINNWPHNYYLAILTTHGVIYSFILFFMIFYYCLYLNLQKDLRFKSWSILLTGFLMVDFMVNASLNQPYYAGILAALVVGMKKFNPFIHVDYRQKIGNTVVMPKS